MSTPTKFFRALVIFIILFLGTCCLANASNKPINPSKKVSKNTIRLKDYTDFSASYRASKLMYDNKRTKSKLS